MLKSKTDQKGRKQHMPESYAAFRSDDELYFQMASILKQLPTGDQRIAKRMLDRLTLKKVA